MRSGNRKKMIVSLTIILLVILLFVLFFILRKKEAVPDAGPAEGCLIFQSVDSSKPCYLESAGGNIDTDTQGNGSSSATSSPVSTGKTPVFSDPALASCDSPVSIERDDCIKSVAVEKKDSTLCSLLKDSISRSDCSNLVSKGEEKPKESFIGTVKNYNFDYRPPASPFPASSATSQPLETTFTEVLGGIAKRIDDAKKNPDSKVTADGFFQRLQSLPIVLYSFSRLQASPGMSLVAFGRGFLDEGNEIHVGNYSVSGLASKNHGSEIAFSLPTGLESGTYEVWVTNSKGTSKDPSRPLQLMITDSPLDPPVITGASPAVAQVDDTVTLTGTNFQGALGLYTSLGVLSTFSVSGSSISFKVSDFELINKIKDKSGIKGRRIPVQVIVGTPQGYNQDSFTFEVQF